MKIEKVLENLEKLFSKWGISSSDWVFTAQYAFRLLGYNVEVRKGHLNIQVNKAKIPWEVGEALETHPQVKTKFSEQYLQFERKTGFEFDIAPVSPKDFKRKSKYTVQHTLPNTKQIRVQTPRGGLIELDIILSLCIDEGWGEEKGVRVLPAVEDMRKALLEKGEKELAKAYGDLVKKYSHFNKRKIRKIPKDISRVKTIKGVVASRGVAKGKVNVVLDPERTEILVTTMTSPKFTIFLHNTVAIVTDEGGMLSHAAIVAREMQMPCIVGTKIATKILKDGDLIEVDANKGIVKILN